MQFRIFLYSCSHSLFHSENISVSLMSLCPSIHSLPLLMFLLSLFPPPLNYRNPSTAFYQAFRPSRLRGSKPVNDRYELGCVYIYVCGPAWLTKTDLSILQLCAPCKRMSILTCHLTIYGVSFFCETYKHINKVRWSSPSRGIYFVLDF